VPYIPSASVLIKQSNTHKQALYVIGVRQVSDTAIFVSTPKATRFLAGANLELPLRVIVGLDQPRTAGREDD